MTVVVYGLGGTIAMTPGGTLTAGQLVASIPGQNAPEVELVDFRELPSSSLRLTDLIELSGLIADRLARGATGVVVTQGTDTLEETAYLLDLLHDRPEPIVVTGAMRSPDRPGADGPANLRAAITVAADPHARDRGCLVAFADEMHAAARVRKTHSTSIGAFRSDAPLGYLVEGKAHFVSRAERRFTLPRPTGTLPRVALITATLGAEEPLLPPGADGLVVAAFGVGHLPEWWVRPVKEAAARIPVVLASRTLAGPVLSDSYDYAGSERDLRAGGLIPAGLLDPYKSRVLLIAALAAGADRAQITAAFASAGGLGPQS